MVGFQQLKEAKPDLFAAAGERYAKWSERLEKHAVDFGKQVTDRVRHDDVWSGPAASRAIPHCDRLRGEVLDNIDEIAGIGKELKRAGREFAAAQHDLNGALEQAEAAGLKVGEDGSIDYPTGKEEAALDVKQLIDKAVQAASQADEQIGSTLQGYIRKLPQTAEAYVAQQRQAGRDAARKIAEYLRDGRTPPEELLDLVRQSADDEYFSAAFANELGADGFEDLPALIGQSEMNDDQRKDLMTSLAKTLGTATNGEGPDLSQAQKRQLIADAASGEVVVEDGIAYRKFWAVGKLLDYGEGHIGGDFLADVSAEIYENRVDLQRWASSPLDGEIPISSADSAYSHDPMLVALEAMDHAPEAGREFFGHEANGELDRMKTLMSEYSGKHPDEEGVLMDAITSASTEFDEVDPQRGTEEYKEAGNIASHFLHYAAEQQQDMGSLRLPTDRAVSSVMAFYYEDLRETLVTDGDSFSGWGAREGQIEHSPFGFRTGAEISLDDAKTLLGEVWDDEVSQNRILAAAATYADANIEHQTSSVDISDTLERDKALNNAFRMYGSDVGEILAAAHGEQIGRAEQADAIAQAGKMLFAVGTAPVSPQGAAAQMGYGAFGLAADGAFDHLGSNAENARAEFAGDVGDHRSAARATIAEMMMRNGEWPQDELETLRQKGWWDDDAGRLRIPPEGTEARADFKLWLDGPAGRQVGDPMEAFDDALETKTGT